MLKIFKYELPLAGVADIRLPVNARLLHVAVQGETPYLWALVDPDAEMEARRFRIAGTGHEILPGHAGTFVGTFFLQAGKYVFHVFDLTPVRAEPL